jgi:membrane protease subunit (stomatin/prohibitin family)
MFMRRRRPLLGAAMVGGTAYVAGKHAVENQNREDEQMARIDALEQQQYQQQQAAYQQPAPAAAPPADDLTTKLTQLKALVDQGVLTQDEFAAAKAKLLAG